MIILIHSQEADSCSVFLRKFYKYFLLQEYLMKITRMIYKIWVYYIKQKNISISVIEY